MHTSLRTIEFSNMFIYAGNAELHEIAARHVANITEFVAASGGPTYLERRRQREAAAAEAAARQG